MQYDCKTIPMIKVQVGRKGTIESLCNICLCKDCTNPVECKKISIMGITYSVRVLIRGNEPSCVVECSGFIA